MCFKLHIMTQFDSIVFAIKCFSLVPKINIFQFDKHNLSEASLHRFFA